MPGIVKLPQSDTFLCNKLYKLLARAVLLFCFQFCVHSIVIVEVTAAVFPKLFQNSKLLVQIVNPKQLTVEKKHFSLWERTQKGPNRCPCKRFLLTFTSLKHWRIRFFFSFSQKTASLRICKKVQIHLEVPKTLLLFIKIWVYFKDYTETHSFHYLRYLVL